MAQYHALLVDADDAPALDSFGFLSQTITSLRSGVIAMPVTSRFAVKGFGFGGGGGGGGGGSGLTIFTGFGFGGGGGGLTSKLLRSKTLR
jgi:hypothetical protein